MKTLVKNFVVVLMLIMACLANTVFAVPVTTGLVLQLDMSSVVADESGNVTSWNDLSGKGNNAVQADGGLQPVLVSSITPTGSSAVRFDGTDDYLGMTPNSTFDGGSFTMFAVYAVDAFVGSSGGMRIANLGYSDIDPSTTVEKNNFTTYCLIVGGATGGARSGSRNIAGSSRFASSGVPEGYAEDTFYIAAATMDSVSATSVGYLIESDGTVTTTDAVTGADAVGSGNNVARIGCGTYGTGNTKPTDIVPGNFFDGWVSEILIYNRVLTSDEMTDVSEYLNAKYIPEPATVTLLMLGLGLFARRGR